MSDVRFMCDPYGYLNAAERLEPGKLDAVKSMVQTSLGFYMLMGQNPDTLH